MYNFSIGKTFSWNITPINVFVNVTPAKVVINQISSAIPSNIPKDLTILSNKTHKFSYNTSATIPANSNITVTFGINATYGIQWLTNSSVYYSNFHVDFSDILSQFNVSIIKDTDTSATVSVNRWFSSSASSVNIDPDITVDNKTSCLKLGGFSCGINFTTNNANDVLIVMQGDNDLAGGWNYPVSLPVLTWGMRNNPQSATQEFTSFNSTWSSSGAINITCSTFNSGSNIWCQIMAFSSAKTSAPYLDGTGCGSFATSAGPNCSLTTLNANDAIIGGIFLPSTASIITAGNGYDKVQSCYVAGGGKLCGENQTVSATVSAFPVNWSLDVADDWLVWGDAICESGTSCRAPIVSTSKVTQKIAEKNAESENYTLKRRNTQTLNENDIESEIGILLRTATQKPAFKLSKFLGRFADATQILALADSIKQSYIYLRSAIQNISSIITKFLTRFVNAIQKFAFITASSTLLPAPIANQTVLIPIINAGSCTSGSQNCTFSGVTSALGAFPTQFQSDTQANDTGVNQTNSSSSSNIFYYQAGTALTDPFHRQNFTFPAPFNNLTYWTWVQANASNTAGLASPILALWNYTKNNWEDVVTGSTATGFQNLTFNITGKNVSAYLGGNGTFFSQNNTFQMIIYFNFAGLDNLKVNGERAIVGYNASSTATQSFSTTSTLKIALTNLATNLFAYFRLNNILATLQNIASRITVELRGVSQKLSLVNAMSDFVTRIANAVQKLSLANAVSRLAVLLKTATQQLTLVNTVSRIVVASRNLTQLITLTNTVSRLEAEFRSATQTFSLTDISSQLAVALKTVVQKLMATIAMTASNMISRSNTLVLVFVNAATNPFAYARTSILQILASVQTSLSCAIVGNTYPQCYPSAGGGGGGGNAGGVPLNGLLTYIQPLAYIYPIYVVIGANYVVFLGLVLSAIAFRLGWWYKSKKKRAA